MKERETWLQMLIKAGEEGATCEQAYTDLTEIEGRHGRLAGEDGGG